MMAKVCLNSTLLAFDKYLSFLQSFWNPFKFTEPFSNHCLYILIIIFPTIVLPFTWKRPLVKSPTEQ